MTALLTWSWHRGNQLVCKYLLFSWKKCNTSWKRRPFVLKVKVVQTKQVTNGLRFHFALFAVSLPISEQFVRVCAQDGAVHAKMTKAIGKMLAALHTFLQPKWLQANSSNSPQITHTFLVTGSCQGSLTSVLAYANWETSPSHQLPSSWQQPPVNQLGNTHKQVLHYLFYWSRPVWLGP